MYFSALCLFNCSLLSDVLVCGLQVSWREQRGIFIAPDWMPVKGKAQQAPAIAAEAAIDPAVSVTYAPDAPCFQAGRQTALESLIHYQGEGRRLF